MCFLKKNGSANHPQILLEQLAGKREKEKKRKREKEKKRKREKEKKEKRGGGGRKE
jgi:hypothetical protein